MDREKTSLSGICVLVYFRMMVTGARVTGLLGSVLSFNLLVEMGTMNRELLLVCLRLVNVRPFTRSTSRVLLVAVGCCVIGVVRGLQC